MLRRGIEKAAGARMDIEKVRQERTVLVIGAPRSGTTWLGKILDSHPMVLYRHEPDTLIRNSHIPRVVADCDVEAIRDTAAMCLDAMVGGRFLKASGTMPLFRKSYRTPLAQQAYSAMVMGLRIAQKATGDVRRMRRMLAPDLVDPQHADDITVVVKSILSRGRANVYAHAKPGMRIVLILRDPFGQVASMLRGVALGKFDADVVLTDCLDTPHAHKYGLTPDLFARLQPVEQYAWHWALLNEKAMDDLRPHANAEVIRYRDLVFDPELVTRSLFKFCDLSWQDQTARFLRVSTTSNLPDSYYQVYKNSMDSLNKWRRQLTTAQQRQIAASLAGTAAWRLYPELHDVPGA
jgi:hypothetical protein